MLASCCANRLMVLLMGLADDGPSFPCGCRQIEVNTASGPDAAAKDKKDADVSKEAAESKDGSKEKEKSKWAKLGLESSAMSALEEKLQEVAVSGKWMKHTIVGCDGLWLETRAIRKSLLLQWSELSVER